VPRVARPHRQHLCPDQRCEPASRPRGDSRAAAPSRPVRVQFTRADGKGLDPAVTLDRHPLVVSERDPDLLRSGHCHLTGGRGPPVLGPHAGPHPARRPGFLLRPHHARKLTVFSARHAAGWDFTLPDRSGTAGPAPGGRSPSAWGRPCRGGSRRCAGSGTGGRRSPGCWPLRLPAAPR
jgi:hypothetical protein